MTLLYDKIKESCDTEQLRQKWITMYRLHYLTSEQRGALLKNVCIHMRPIPVLIQTVGPGPSRCEELEPTLTKGFSSMKWILICKSFVSFLFCGTHSPSAHEAAWEEFTSTYFFGVSRVLPSFIWQTWTGSSSGDLFPVWNILTSLPWMKDQEPEKPAD